MVEDMVIGGDQNEGDDLDVVIQDVVMEDQDVEDQNRAEHQVDHRNLADQVKKAQADDNKVQTSILSFFAKK